MSNGVSRGRGERDGPVPMIPTPSTPPRAEMNAVTVGRRSVGRPALGMTIVTVVPPCMAMHELFLYSNGYVVEDDGLAAQRLVHRLECSLRRVR